MSTIAACSPWTGKCIGKYNLPFFYGFLWSMTALLVYVVACTLVWTLTKAVPQGQSLL